MELLPRHPRHRRVLLVSAVATVTFTALTTTFLVAFLASANTATGSHSAPPTRQDIVFAINATSFTGEDAWITATWSASEADLKIGSGDYVCYQDSFCTIVKDVNLWVGVFPASANITSIGPQEWPESNPPWLATAPIAWKPLYTTVGQVQFHLERQREDQFLALFGNGTIHPVMLRVSPIVRFNSSGLPNHVHIARTDSVDEMRVMWQSKFGDASQVRWGFKAKHYTFSAPAIAVTYQKSDLCGPPATTHGWLDPGYLFNAVISGIDEGQYVYYIVGNDQHGWSEESRFRGVTRPNATASLNITVVADVGLTYIDGSQYHWMEPHAIETTSGMEMAWDDNISALPNLHRDQTSHSSLPAFHHTRHLSSRAAATFDRTDVIVHVGDISYATGYASKWDRFLKQIEPLASRIPYMTGHGNHERDYPLSGDAFGGGDSGGECGVATSTRFVMPVPANATGAWYSFEQGPVHFVMMDTEISWVPGSPQYTFLETDLMNVDRQVTPWVIFMGHRPLYSLNVLDPNFKVLESLLFQAQVDVCLWGHVHNAQVTCPVYNGTCVTAASPGDYDAPIHAVIGNGGQSLTAFPTPRAAWSVYENSEFGFSTIQVKGATKLVMKFYADGTNHLDYHFTINRKARV